MQQEVKVRQRHPKGAVERERTDETLSRPYRNPKQHQAPQYQSQISHLQGPKTRREQALSDKMAALLSIWESYAQLIRRKTDRRSDTKLQQRRLVLDKFLAYFVSASLENEGDIFIGEMRNIANELSQELMRNVESVSRGVREEDATRSLEEYILRGRGWRLLYVIDKVGLKGVVQLQDLSEVLLHLLPYCLHMSPCGPDNSKGSEKYSNDHNQNALPTDQPTNLSQEEISESQKYLQMLSDEYDVTLPLSSCFQFVNRTNRLKQLGCPSAQTRKVTMGKVRSTGSLFGGAKGDAGVTISMGISPARSGSGRVEAKLGGSRTPKKRMTRTTASKSYLKPVASDSEEEEDCWDHHRDDWHGPRRSLSEERSRGRQPRLRRGIRTTYLWTIPSLARDSDSETDDDYLGHMFKPDLEDQGGVSGALSSVTGFHVVRIILRLLKSLGELDVKLQNGPRGKTLSATILPHLLFLFNQFRQVSPSGKVEQKQDTVIGNVEMHLMDELPGASHDNSTNQPSPDTQEEHIEKDIFDDSPTESDSMFSKAKESTRLNITMSSNKQNDDLRKDEEDEDDDCVPWEGPGRLLLMRQLVRVILALSGVVSTQQNGVRILMNFHVMETLLDTDILDSLIQPALVTESSDTGLEATTALEIVCGVLQLLQTVYLHLPFNPSCVSDANYLAACLTHPEVGKRVRQLITVSEFRNEKPISSSSSSMSSGSEAEPKNLVQNETNRPNISCGERKTFDKIEKQENLDLRLGVSIEKKETTNRTPVVDPQINSNSIQEDSSRTKADIEPGEMNYAQGGKISLKSDGENFKDCKRIQHENVDIGTGRSCGVCPNPSTVLDSTMEFPSDGTSDPVRCIGALITTLKSIKVNYIHSMKCLKQRHRNCEYGSYYDHHHDILGSAYYIKAENRSSGEGSTAITKGGTDADADFEHSFNLGGKASQPKATFRRGSLAGDADTESGDPDITPRCVVAELSALLLASIGEVKQKSSQVHVISTMGSVGLCCCLQPERVVSAILPQLTHFSPAVRGYALDMLTSILLDQFLGAAFDNHQVQMKKVSPNASAKGRTTGASNYTFESRDRRAEPGHGRTFSNTADPSGSRCVHCCLEGPSPLLAGLPSALDSGLASGHQVEELWHQRRLDRWKCLRSLGKQVLNGGQGDPNRALSLARHLVTLAVRGNKDIKEELFFGVYQHVLHMKVALPGPIKGEASEVSTIVDGEELLKTSLDSLSMSGGDISSTDEGYNSEGGVSGTIMLLSVSALPYLLQVDRVMSVFLSRHGLARLTQLLDYKELRTPVMSVFEALVMLDERRLNNNYNLQLQNEQQQQQLLGHQTTSKGHGMGRNGIGMTLGPLSSTSNTDQASFGTYEGGGVIQTFIDTVASRTCTVTATLQHISLQREKMRAAAAAAAAASAAKAKASFDDNNDAKTASPAASEFLDLYRSSIKKSNSKVSFSIEEKEEESGQDLTAMMTKAADIKDLVMDVETVFGDMKETLPVLLDMWKTCAKLCMNSRMFRLFFRESPWLYVVQETLVLALSLFGETTNVWQDREDGSQDTSASTRVSSRKRGRNPSQEDGYNSGSTRINEESSHKGKTKSKFWRKKDKDVRSGGQSRGWGQQATDVEEESGEREDQEVDNNDLVGIGYQTRLEFIEAVMMVCFSCRTIAPSQKRGEEDDLWVRLGSALHNCISLPPCKLAAVFQMLLNVALPRCPSVLEYSYSQIVSMLNLREKEDIADEDEVSQLLQSGLDEDGDTIYTERGYDGDTECSVSFDWKTGLEYSLKHRRSSLWSSPAALGRPCYPAVFRLVMELLVACHRDAERGVILHTVALRLLQTLRSSRRAVAAVCSQGLLGTLLEGFREVLTAQPLDTQQLTLQEIILSLVQVIAQSQISASELRQFLRLFQDNTQTSNSLLSTLLAVIEKHTVGPTSWAMFPTKTLVAPEFQPGSSEDADVSHASAWTPGEQIVWHHAAVEMDVPGLAWPPWPVGFSLVLWMCVDRCECSGGVPCCNQPGGPSDRDAMSHHSQSEELGKETSPAQQLPSSECSLVTAIGNTEKMFEVWVHPKTASLIIKLTTGLEEATLLKEVVFEGLLTPDVWQMLSISYVDVLEGSTFVGKMTLTLDGWLRREVILDHPASGRRPLRKHPFLCIGDAQKRRLARVYTGTWKLGTVRVFRDTVLSGDWWYHLYSLGPNHDGVAKCDSSEQPPCYTHTHSMLKQMLHSPHLSWDTLVGATIVPDIDLARASQVLVYKISQPEVYSTFAVPVTAQPQTSISSDLGLVPISGSDLMTQKPQVWSAKLRGRIKVRDDNTLERAVERLGGIDAFLFLVAKIYESSMQAVSEGTCSIAEAEHLQSKSVSIVVGLVRRFPSLARSFYDNKGYDMLARIFTSSKSMVGFQLLKVLLDACTTESVFKSVSSGLSGAGGSTHTHTGMPSAPAPHPQLRNQPEAVIRDQMALTHLILHWRVWQRATDDVRVALMGAVHALVCPENPYRAFNLKQMQVGNVLNKIFSIYLERIQDGQPSLSVAVSLLAAKVIKNLLGSPPDLHLMMAVMDFLLSVHPAPDGFISFNPEAFYFKLWWDGKNKGRAQTNQSSSKPHEMKLKPEQASDSVLTFSSSSHNLDSSLEVRPRTELKRRWRRHSHDLTSSNSHTDDCDQEYDNNNRRQQEDEFKFPPLKPAARRPSEQTPDMDADHEAESDHGKVISAQKAPAKISSIRPLSVEAGEFNHSETSEVEYREGRNDSFGDDEDTHLTSRVVKPERKYLYGTSKTKGNIAFAEGAVREETSPSASVKHRRRSYRKQVHGDLREEVTRESEKRRTSELLSDDEYKTKDRADRRKSDPDPHKESKLEAALSYDSVVNDEGSSESQEEADEQGLMKLCVCLLEMLTQIILEYPEPALNNVFSKVVSPQSMLVLAKNPSPDMRLAVMKLLGAYLFRAPTSLIDSFIKMDGFFLLANQLHTFPVQTSHVEAAISILLQQNFSFDDNLIMSELGELSTLQQAAPILLLSLLEGTVNEPELCRNCLAFLAQLLQSGQTMSTLLLDLGLAETLCNLATTIQRRSVMETNSEEEQLTLALLIDVQHVLCLTAVNEFGWSGQTHAQSFEDMFTLLRALEDQEFSEQSDGSKKRADNARALQISLVVKIFAFVEKRSEDATQLGWFSSSTSTGSGFIDQTSSASMYRSHILTGRPYSSPILSQSYHHYFHHSTATHSRMHHNAGVNSLGTDNSHGKMTSSYSASVTSPSAGVPLSSLYDVVPPVDPSSAFASHLHNGKLHHHPRPPLHRSHTFTTSDFVVDFLADAALDSSLDSPIPITPSDSGIGNPTSPYASAPRRSIDSRSSSSNLASGLLGNLFNRKRKVTFAPVSQTELLDRFKRVLVTATDLATMFPREEKMRPVKQRTLNYFSESATPSLEDRYLKHLFEMVFRFYQQSLNKEMVSRKNRNPIMYSAKDALKTQFARLLLCMMSLKMDFDFRTTTVEFLMSEPRGPDAIKSVIVDKQVATELSLYTYNLLSSWRDWLNQAQREAGYSLVQLLRLAGVTVCSPEQQLTQAQVNALVEDKKHIDARYRKDLLAWLQRRESGISRISNKLEHIHRRVVEQAMSVTQAVTRLQIEERKKLVEHIKQGMTEQIRVKKQWQGLVTSLSHERGVWYHETSYPKAWLLDPTEGPGRVRCKLQRGHLSIKPRFLLPDYQYKLDAEEVEPPLVFLFEDDHPISDSAALIYRLYTNEKIQHTCRCTAVSPANESKGELLVGEVSIFFVADIAITGGNCTQLLLGNLDQLSITWPHTDIRELHKRWYQLQDLGLEIFLVSGRTCLLAFESTQDRDELYRILHSQLELPNVVTPETLAAVQQAWLQGDLTNFDYLMHLNKVAGRSYADLMQYPVFPFVLRDYHSASLNLTDIRIYRNLKKPIAVQDKTREQRYLDNYEFLCQEAVKPFNETDELMMQVPPFHYGSHYSNSGTVLHYLVRLPPFTSMFLTFQDQSFDIPDRTFHSLGTSWRLSSYESSTDVKELIPEFFFLPEMFQNAEGFDFGSRQNGEQVNDVCLPAWCNGDARLFVLIHRQALESSYVTTHLNNWLDLVFGYKQQGEEAVRAINVFHPATYFGVDASQIKDPVKRHALLTMIRTYGQTPKQLFRNPHPQGQVSGSSQFPVSLQIDDNRGHRGSAYVRRPVPQVFGLQWGVYLGSPDFPPPVWLNVVPPADPIARNTQAAPASSLPQSQAPSSSSSSSISASSTTTVEPRVSGLITRLVAVPNGQVFGVEACSNMLLLHGKHRDYKSTDVMWAGVVTWGYHDNLIRIRSYHDKPLINFLPQPFFGTVTCIESLPDCRLLFTAGSAGVIVAHTMTHNSSKPSCLQVRGIKQVLSGHSAAVTALAVCPAFSVLVSSSEDGSLIVWDLNTLTYTRSLWPGKDKDLEEEVQGATSNTSVREDGKRQHPVTGLAVSFTLGDIASVLKTGSVSCELHVHTINGRLVARKVLNTDLIHCLAYSAAPEGRSVNVVATGLQSGVIRLWSSWDLTPLRDLTKDGPSPSPVISLTFSADSQFLLASHGDGCVTMWDKDRKGLKTHAERFIPVMVRHPSK